MAPGVMRLIGQRGRLVGPPGVHRGEHDGEAKIHSASDYSYHSFGQYAGPGWRIVGDAGGALHSFLLVSKPNLIYIYWKAFIDTFFSSGVHLAMTSALSGAATICAALRGDCEEREAVAWHRARVSTSFARCVVGLLRARNQPLLI
jgi:hypothetical protein